MRAGIPRRRPFRFHHFDYILEIARDCDSLPVLRPVCHFKDIRESIVTRVVIDGLDPTFLVLTKRSKLGVICHYAILPWSAARQCAQPEQLLATHAWPATAVRFCANMRSPAMSNLLVTDARRAIWIEFPRQSLWS